MNGADEDCAVVDEMVLCSLERLVGEGDDVDSVQACVSVCCLISKSPSVSLFFALFVLVLEEGDGVRMAACLDDFILLHEDEDEIEDFFQVLLENG